MCTLDRTGIEQLLIDSIAENVILHSKVPVMVVREKRALKEKQAKENIKKHFEVKQSILSKSNEGLF